MNVKRMTRGDGWIALIIAAFVLCALVGLGAYAKSQPCDGFERYGYSLIMCKGGGGGED